MATAGLVAEAVFAQVRQALLAQLGEGMVELCQVSVLRVQAHRQAGQLVITHIRENLAEGAQP
ncbi:hypothetical protein D3C77_819840 [compost metagenome]